MQCLKIPFFLLLLIHLNCISYFTTELLFSRSPTIYLWVSASVVPFLQLTAQVYNLTELSIPMLPEGYFILMTISIKSAHYSWILLLILKYVFLQFWKKSKSNDVVVKQVANIFVFWFRIYWHIKRTVPGGMSRKAMTTFIAPGWSTKREQDT